MNLLKANWERILIDNLIWLIILLFGAVMSVVSPAFFSFSNVNNILFNSTVLGVLVIAEAIVLMLGYFDLSIAATLGVTAVFGAWLMVSINDGGSGIGLHPMVAMAVMLCLGMLIGYANGTMITRLGMSPFIVTLAMLILLQGMSFVISSGQTIAGLPPAFTFLGSALVGAIPLSVILVLLMYVAGQSVLSTRPIGRHIYAIGGNPDAAKASGIAVDRVIRGAFVLAGALSAVAGILLAGQLSSVTANFGQGLIFDVMAAAVIGGISLKGGRGSLVGAFGGVLLFSMISSALNLTDISSFWIDVVKGSIILLAVFLDSQKDPLRRYFARRRLANRFTRDELAAEAGNARASQEREGQ